MNSEANIDLLRNSLRREILKHLVERDEPLSPGQVSRELGKPVSGVAYHLRVLDDGGAAALVGPPSVQGSMQRQYTHQETFSGLTWVREILGLPPVDGMAR